jgi:hypothetical protein
MAEYLAHIHGNTPNGLLFNTGPLDGLLYESVQKTGGTNVVLFPGQTVDAHNPFPIAYVANSIKFFQTMTIGYEHFEKGMRMSGDEIVRLPDGDETWEYE